MTPLAGEDRPVIAPHTMHQVVFADASKERDLYLVCPDCARAEPLTV